MLGGVWYCDVVGVALAVGVLGLTFGIVNIALVGDGDVLAIKFDGDGFWS